MAISMLKIRRPLGRLIFNMGIAIPDKTLFLIEMALRSHFHIAALGASFIMGIQHFWSDNMLWADDVTTYQKTRQLD